MTPDELREEIAQKEADLEEALDWEKHYASEAASIEEELEDLRAELSAIEGEA